MSVHCALWAAAPGNAFQCCYVALMHMPGFLRRILTQLSYLCFSRECLYFFTMHHLSNIKCFLKAVACFLGCLECKSMQKASTATHLPTYDSLKGHLCQISCTWTFVCTHQ